MSRKSITSAIALIASAFIALAAPSRAAVKLASSQVANGLSSALFAASPPGDTARLFVVRQSGQINIINLADNSTNAAPFLDISAKVNFGGEQGLLGMAFHPDYSSNGYFYVYYSASASLNVLERYTVSSDPNLANTNSAFPILQVTQPATNHNGGWIGFGPIDHYLYIAKGDGGGGCDTFGHAQVLANSNASDPTSNLLAKILRIDVNGDDFASTNRNYAIPPTNPFANTNGDDEIWAWGLRNPFRDSFDRLTGDFWIADVGQNFIEEIDFQPAGDPGGRNYGWPCNEGFECSNATGSCSTYPASYCVCNDPSFVPPIYEYSHSDGSCAIIGGNVYRGSAIPDLQGTYFFSDNCHSTIRSFRYMGGMLTDLNTNHSELGSFGSVAGFGEDANGELYIVSLNGTVKKIVRHCTITIGSLTDQSACAGGSATFTIPVSNPTGAVTYTWRHNGNTFGAPSSPTLNLTSLQPTDAGQYSVDVQDTCENVLTSNTATLSVVFLGDLNADCAITPADLPIFINVLLGLDTAPTHLARADLDSSGTVDGQDIPPFVTVLLHP